MIAVPFLNDLRSAIRILLRSCVHALTSIAVLALGIGANVAIFSVVYSVVLSPLPYPDASRLVFVWQRLRVLSDPVSWLPATSRRKTLLPNDLILFAPA